MIEKIKNSLFGSRRQAREIAALTEALKNSKLELEKLRSEKATDVSLFVQIPPDGGEVFLLSDEEARDRMSALQIELYLANIDRFTKRMTDEN